MLRVRSLLVSLARGLLYSAASLLLLLLFLLPPRLAWPAPDSAGAAGAPAARLLQFVNEHPVELAGARAALAAARDALRAPAPPALPQPAYSLLARAGELAAEADAALALLERAPVLLGADRPRTYLVLAQNNDELRPTGGFISAVGLVRVERGELAVEWFGDSYAVDDLRLIHAPPPAPLARYMWASQWLLRDSNWYADFPTSADVAASMVARDRGWHPDGVIAVDMRLLPSLLDAMDGLELDGRPVGGANIVSQLKESWKPLPPGDMSDAWFQSDRKNFLSSLMRGLMASVKTGNVRPAALAAALYHGLRDRSLQVYLTDEPSENALRAAGWAGTVEPRVGDYLFVVDSNLGFNKVNAHVTRELAYTVSLPGARAVLDVTWNNPSPAASGGCDLLKQHKDDTYASMEQSCYWDYLRVLTPPGSQLLSADGLEDAGPVEDVSSVTAFGGYAVVPRATVQRAQLSWALPRSILSDHAYSLTVQQQAGAGPAPLTVRVELPAGVRPMWASEPFTQPAPNVVEFQLVLERDLTLSLFLEPIP